MTSFRKVLGFGSALVDILCNVDDSYINALGDTKGFRRIIDEKTFIDMLATMPSTRTSARGGAAANTIAALGKLGDSTEFLCKLAHDDAGDFFKQELKNANVSTKLLKYSDNLPTGCCISMITPDAERTMRSCLGAAASMTTQDIEAADFEGCSLLYIEAYTIYNKELFIQTLEYAKESHLEIHMDLASPEIVQGNREFLIDIISKYTFAVYANKMEAAALSGTDDVEKAVDFITGLCPLAIVKLGADGSIIADRHGHKIHTPAQKVKAIDTTAAGDLWAAGFLHGYINDWPLAKSAEFASMTSGEIVQVTGAALPPEIWEQLKTKASVLIQKA